MSIGMKGLGLVAVMALVGCAGELSDEKTGKAGQALDTTSGHVRDINVEICEGGDQPVLDPMFASWADAALNQDPSEPSVTFGAATARWAGAKLPDVHADAVIAEMAIHPRSKDAAHLTLRIVEPTATSSDPVWVACAFPVPVPVYEYRVVAVDEAGAVGPMSPVALGAMHVAIDERGAQNGTFEMTLRARDAEVLEARATTLRLRIEGLPATDEEPTFEKVIGNVTPDAARIGELKVRGIAILQGATPSYVVSARLSGLRRIAATADSDVVVTFAIDNASDETAARMLNNKNPELTK